MSLCRSLPLALVLAAFLAVGCGGADSADSADAPAEPAAPADETTYVPAYPEEVSDEGLSEADAAQQETLHTHADGEAHDHEEGDHEEHGHEEGRHEGDDHEHDGDH